MSFCCGFGCCVWMMLVVALSFGSFVWVMFGCGLAVWLFNCGGCFFVVGYSLCYFFACLFGSWCFDVSLGVSFACTLHGLLL